MKATAVLEFAQADDSATGRKFGLRQKPFVKKAPSGFEAWLIAQGLTLTIPNSFLLYGQYRSGCTSTGILDVTLQVRLEEIDTPYVLRASYGMLDPHGMLITESRREFLAFELVTEKEVDFGTITSATWNGDVYNESGDIIVPPAITISGNTVTLPESVYGVIEVEVSEELYEHRLTITPRAPTLPQAESENDISAELYASTVMLFCEQRITLLDVEKPEDQGTCLGQNIRIIPPDPDDPDDTERYAVTFEVFDFCTGRVLPNARVSVAGGTPVGDGSPVMLPAGTHSVVATASGYTDSNRDDLSDNDSFTLGPMEP